MKFGLSAAIAIGIFVGLPGLALAQPQPQGSSHNNAAPRPAVHAPAPVMRAPTTHFHAAPVERHVTSRPTAVHHTIHRSTISHTHRVVHHVQAVHRIHPGAVHHSARIRALRRDVVARHRFHAGIYRAPPGYRYRRWHYGAFLPGVYWGRDFWISDFLAFGLFAPPAGFVWVRYGPDALLIDEYTGEIIQVDYGVFY